MVNYYECNNCGKVSDFYVLRGHSEDGSYLSCPRCNGRSFTRMEEDYTDD